MSFAAVQKHVAVLEGAELVIKRRQGREQLVRGNVQTVRDAYGVLEQFEAMWRRRIDRFGEALADDAGNPNPDMPVMIIRVVLSELPHGGTRMTIETTFPSPEAMEQIISMGMEEGMALAIGQIDDLLRAEATSR